MKIAFPTQVDLGDQSAVYGHFGSAPLFIIVDSDSGELEAVANKDLDHSHGQCQPLAALGSNPVDAVVAGGIGGGALIKLNNAGVTVYRAIEGTVSENLQLINSGKLPEFTKEQTCSHDHGNEGCAH